MKKRATISFRLMVTMIVIVLLTVGIGWVFNSAFLETYYVHHKQKELLNSFREIDAAAEGSGLLTTEFDISFERICTNGNISIIIMEKNGKLLRSSALNEQSFLYELNQMIFGVNPEDAAVISSADNYTLERLTDRRMQSEYLVLWGVLSDGSYIYMKTALESIRESAQITKRFFLWIGIASSLLCMVAAAVAAKAISLQEANIGLRRDIEKKEQIDTMRKEFLSNVSHELKTPLALISGYAEGLAECVDDDDAESRSYYCAVIMDESAKMNRMVQKLLTLNQLEFGADALEMSCFDITELIAGVVQATERLAKQQGITVCFAETDEVFVRADEYKAEEVISNYLSNARNHADGEKQIRIFYTRRADVLRISVFNTGKPIPEEDIDYIWDKFYKVDKARTREYGGSGIGLSIVKAIMDSFHQDCGVINHGNGVEFWMELELAPQ